MERRLTWGRLRETSEWELGGLARTDVTRGVGCGVVGRGH